MASQLSTRAIPLLDLRRQFDPIRDEVMREVERVIESQRFILGAEVERFERASQSIAARVTRSAAPPAPMRWSWL